MEGSKYLPNKVQGVQDLPSLYFTLLGIRRMLRKVMAVEVCDATKFNKHFVARYKNIQLTISD